MIRSKLALIAAGALVIAASCGGDDDDAGSVAEAGDDAGGATVETSAPPAPAPTTSPATTPATSAPEAPATTEAPTTTEPPPTTAPATDWVMHETGDDCMCADGSEYVYFSRPGDPDKVMLYFQGGGGCFSAETCSFTDGNYKVTTGPDDFPSRGTGIFDTDNAANPLRDYSIVFVPYCTGDVHIGDATTEYADDLIVEHNGFVNASHGLDHAVANFPDLTHLFVTGSSAGGVPAPLFGGLAADLFPDADIAVLADASGGYPSLPGLNAGIGTQLWGSFGNVPDWPEVEDVTAEEWGIPDLFRFAGIHDPDIRMARYDNAWDDVQSFFSSLAGVGEEGLPAVLDQNEELAEAAGVDLDVYIAPGTDHTILGRDELYELEVEGVAFVDWLTTHVEGGDAGDVRCVDCEPPAG